MSTHEIPIVRIAEIEKHPNADRLGIVKIFGWTCCIGLDSFKEGDLAAYIPPDYVVQTTRPEFKFLNDGKKIEQRIKVKKLRGIISQGLLIPAPFGSQEGDNVIEQLGIKRYEPPPEFKTGGENERAPSGLYAPKYDVESLQRYNHLLVEGEEVICSEKIHGANARFCYGKSIDGTYKMYCGSRSFWKKKYDQNLWWSCLKQNPWIEQWCKDHPDMLLYGEAFGQVQTLKYGASSQQVFFAAFDILNKDEWLSYDVCQDLISGYPNFKWVPLVYRGPFNYHKLIEISDNLDSLWMGAKHYAEGIVVKPIVERYSPSIGRVQLKIVSNRYLLNS